MKPETKVYKSKSKYGTRQFWVGKIKSSLNRCPAVMSCAKLSSFFPILSLYTKVNSSNIPISSNFDGGRNIAFASASAFAVPWGELQDLRQDVAVRGRDRCGIRGVPHKSEAEGIGSGGCIAHRSSKEWWRGTNRFWAECGSFQFRWSLEAPHCSFWKVQKTLTLFYSQYQCLFIHFYFGVSHNYDKILTIVFGLMCAEEVRNGHVRLMATQTPGLVSLFAWYIFL